MQATLVNYTPNPELNIVAAARSSASQSIIEELWHKLSPHQVGNLLKRLLDSGHLSPFEHASFTLGCCDERESCGIFTTMKSEARAK